MSTKAMYYYKRVEPLYRSAIFKEGMKLDLDTDEMASMYQSNIANHRNVITYAFGPSVEKKTFSQKFRELFRK